MKENNTTTSNNFTDFPFSDIPASLVEELLSKTTQIGNDIFNSINIIKKKKYYFRSQLDQSNILANDSEIKTQFLTSCAVDGAYAIERLLGSDLIAIGAVGVEGLNSSDKKEGKWQSPNHSVFINTEKHDPENMIAARGLMIEMEINLAANSPYDLVFLDGSLTTGLIHMYKAIDFIEKRRTVIADKIRDSYKEFLTSYKKILES
ncbi:MAG: DNA double-strand break repair nuclease NurA, partial [Nitrososphaeraceae archaeon]|nr:DNA double-strand break repair nuclease NurA [Nitrososphaeraceae archaeon]